MSKINSKLLSEVKVQDFDAIRDKWIAASRSTDRIDRHRVKDCITLLYASLKIKHPDIYFFDSPQSALESTQYQKFFIRKQNLYTKFIDGFLLLSFGLLFLLLVWIWVMFLVITAMIFAFIVIDIPIFKYWFSLNKDLGGLIFVAIFLGGVCSIILATPQLAELIKKGLNPIGILFTPIGRGIYRWWLWQSPQLLLFLKKYFIEPQITEIVQNLPFQNWLDSQYNLDSQYWLEREITLLKKVSDTVFKTVFQGRLMPIQNTVVHWKIPESIYLDISLSGGKKGNAKILANWLNLLQESGLIFINRRACLICDRPTQLSFDAMGELHADGKAAIAFADGLKIYARHGTIIPEQYGATPSDRWSASWLLNERNAELRRMLVQKIGYERLALELNTNCIDTWREYELLELPPEIPEQFKILKMICPSTGALHFLTVPPEIDNAREAACWVNWDIDPDDFAIET